MSGSHSTAPGINGKSHRHNRSDLANLKNEPDHTYGTDEEHHEEEPRGTWYPVEICDLYDNAVISATEFILLGLIDRLVTNRTKNEKKIRLGCWASNFYLGKRVHRSERQVIRLINHLKEIGAVEEVGQKYHKGYYYRILETKWTRVDKRQAKTHPENSYRTNKKHGGGMDDTPTNGNGHDMGDTPGHDPSVTQNKKSPSDSSKERIKNPPTPRGTGSPSARPSREGRGQSASQFFETDEEGQGVSPDSPSARQAPDKEEHQDTDEFFDGYPEGAPVWTVGYSSNYDPSVPDEPEDEDTPDAPATPAPDPKERPAPKRGALPDPFAKRNSPAQRLANRLHKIVNTNRAKHRAPAHTFPPSVWTKWMRKLLESRAEDEVAKLLTWYAQTIGEKFIPDCQGPKQFYEKYGAIETAMSRDTCTDEQDLADELDRKDGKIPRKRKLGPNDLPDHLIW